MSTESRPTRSSHGSRLNPKTASEATIAPTPAPATPIGTFTRNVSRQPSITEPNTVGSIPVSHPPSSRPTAAPRPDIIAYTANALLRLGPGANVVVIRASAFGNADAAQEPLCRA